MGAMKRYQKVTALTDSSWAHKFPRAMARALVHAEYHLRASIRAAVEEYGIALCDLRQYTDRADELRSESSRYYKIAARG